MPALWTDPRIKTLFSQTVLENLNYAHVWSQGFNTNWEGEIRNKGSTVRIFSFPRIAPSAYTVPAGALSSQIITYQRPGATSQELVIDQDYIWPIAEDDFQARLAKPDTFAEMSKSAAWSMVDVSDRDLAMILRNGAGTANPITGTGTGSAPIVGNGAADDITAYTLMERLAEALAVGAIPADDLHLFCPKWFMTMIRTDPRFSGFGTDASRRTARGEMIVELAGITIHETLNAIDGAGTAFSAVPDGNSQNEIVVNWKGAATWARMEDPNSMTDTISRENNPLSRDNLMRSYYLWGGKVTIAQGVVRQLVQRGSYEP